MEYIYNDIFIVVLIYCMSLNYIIRRYFLLFIYWEKMKMDYVYF